MKHYKLLIVDDEKRFAHMLAKRLELRGCVCDVCYSGKEAMEIIKRKQFFLILLDLHLPDIYGIEVLRRIKKNPSDTPVVILTGHGTEDDRRECVKQGAHAFLHKPSSIEELMTVITQLGEKSA